MRSAVEAGDQASSVWPNDLEAVGYESEGVACGHGFALPARFTNMDAVM
jgi:hypothetical protein